MIIPVFKPLGHSSHQLAAAIGAKRGEKATHTGTLDPMAEGVLIVLTGDDRFRKSELSATKKTYQFQILFGISTDSHDLLGLPTEVFPKLLSANDILSKLHPTLTQMIGTSIQTQPFFSAGREQGTSLFELAKAGKTLTKVHTNQISIASITVDEISTLPSIEVLLTHTNNISKVTGDFRQDDIRKAWDTCRSKLPKNLVVATCTATVSKRTYIRGIVRDISKTLDIPATTFSILRTHNGEYSLEDCQKTT